MPLSWLLALLLALAVALGYDAIAGARDRRRYPAPGRLVDIGGVQVHLVESGSGRYTVVLESALAGSSLSWGAVQREVSAFARVVSYDRLGFGWSDAAPSARTLDQMTTELRALVRSAPIDTPLVIVGHSYGGWLAERYWQRYPEDVAGLVLVDSPHPRTWSEPSPPERARARRGARIARRASLLARLGLMRGVLTLLARAGRGRSPDERGRVGALLAETPPEVRGPLRAFWVRASTLSALASQIENAEASARELLESRRPFGAVPLVVLTASNPSDDRRREQEETRELSSAGRHVVASRSGHFVPLQEPELIVSAIREVVALAEQEDDEQGVARDE